MPIHLVSCLFSYSRWFGAPRQMPRDLVAAEWDADQAKARGPVLDQDNIKDKAAAQVPKPKGNVLATVMTISIKSIWRCFTICWKTTRRSAAP